MMLFFSDRLDIDIAHEASFVRPGIWNWWDYSDGVSGPAQWGFYFRHCDGGRFQSPINIESRYLLFDYQLDSDNLKMIENSQSSKLLLQWELFDILF